jgi:hypothetical protein
MPLHALTSPLTTVRTAMAQATTRADYRAALLAAMHLPHAEQEGVIDLIRATKLRVCPGAGRERVGADWVGPGRCH